MTQADEEDELELPGPSGERELADDVEDIEVDAEVESVEAAADLAVDDEEEEEAEGGGGGGRSKRPAAEPVAVEDVANIEARRHVREQLESDVEAFLSRGGKIVEVAEDVRADPPKKPESKYGTRSI